MPLQRSPEFVALMVNASRAITFAMLMLRKSFLSSGDWWISTELNIALLHRSIRDQHRARFIPTSEVLEDPSGKPRKMQPIIQEMILGRKRGVMLIPECEDDAVDVIAGLIEQGFQDLASEYRDFIIGQLEKAKAKV